MRDRIRRLATVCVALGALVIGSSTATAAAAEQQFGNPALGVNCWGISGLTHDGWWPFYRMLGSGSTHCDREVYKIKVRTWMTDNGSRWGRMGGYDMSVRYHSRTSGVTSIRPFSTCFGHQNDTIQVYSKHTIYVTKDSPKWVMWTQTGTITC